MEKIKLFKENRLDQEREVSLDEIAKGFTESKYFELLKGWSLTRALWVYIGAKDGLNSSFDGEDNQVLEKARLYVHEYMKQMNLYDKLKTGN